MRFPQLLVLALSATAATVATQSGPDHGDTATAGTLPELPGARRDFSRDALIPLHTAADDVGVPYGLWAAGDSYKASFHDGFRFVPYLGVSHPTGHQLRWQTIAAQHGERALLTTDTATLPGPRVLAAGRRCEYQLGGLTEAYDIRSDGVEQTFVIDRHPGGSGDLVITGRITTELRSPTFTDLHRAVTFQDAEGHTVIEYGSATVVDDAGRSTPVLTSWDGSGRLALRVPAAWLDGATFPVVVDPLLTRGCLGSYTSSSAASGRVTGLDLREDGSHGVLAHTRWVSQHDGDLWVWKIDTDGNRQELLFSDLSSLWDTVSPAVARTQNHWLIGFIRRNVGGPGIHGLRYHRRGRTDRSYSTSYHAIPLPFGTVAGEVIDVGGGDNDLAFFAYERTSSGSNTDVYGRSIDAGSNSLGTEYRMEPRPVGNATRLRPSINQHATVSALGLTGWVVAWQEYSDALPLGRDDWDINLRRIGSVGQPLGDPRQLDLCARAPNTVHHVAPVVEGMDPYFAIGLAAHQEVPTTKTLSAVGSDLWVETFRWSIFSDYSPVAAREVTAGYVSDRRWVMNGLAFDRSNASYWAVLFESRGSGAQYAGIVGHDAGVVDLAVAHQPAGGARAFLGAATFRGFTRDYLISYASDETGVPCGTSSNANNPVYTQVMEYRAAPPWRAVRTSNCGSLFGIGLRPVSGALPGNRRFAVSCSLVGLQPTLFIAAGTGFTRAPFGQDCYFLLDAATLSVNMFPSVTYGFTPTAVIPVPSAVRGTVYFQAAYIQSGQTYLSERLEVDFVGN